jgi:hypothetical protein
MKKILLTLAAAFGLAIAGSGTAWADTETLTTFSSGVHAKNAAVSGTCFSIDGVYVADYVSDTEFKLRMNVTTGSLANTVKIDVADGYTISELSITAKALTKNSTLKISAVYVDDDLTTNQISSDISFTTTSSTQTIKGLNASKAIYLVTDAGSSQIQFAATFTYTDNFVKPSEGTTDITTTWALTGGNVTDDPTYSVTNEGFSVAGITVGDSLSVNSTLTYSSVIFTQFKNPYTSKSVATKGHLVTFTLTPKKGITFVPTQVSFKAIKSATDHGSLTYDILSGSNRQILQSGKSINRNNNSNAVSEFSASVSGIRTTSDAPCNLEVYFYDQPNAKSIGLSDVVITGYYYGTAEEEVTYTIESSVTPAGSGTITQKPGNTTLVAGTAVSFTANPTAGYKFVKWTDANGASLSEEATYSVESLEANLNVIAVFEKLPWITYQKDASDETIEGSAPSVAYCSTEKVTLEKNYTLYKPGYTQTGWTDGTTVYAVGGDYTVIGDVTMTAVFTENVKTLAELAAESRLKDVNVVWSFDKSAGAPVLNIEGSTGIYVIPATFNGTTLDLKMAVDTRKSQVISGYTSNGKLNNVSQANRAQVNKGTKFTIPVIAGGVVKIGVSSGTLSESTINGEKASSYTATEDGDIDIIIADGSMYLTGITVTYALNAYAVSISDLGAATFSAPIATTIPENVKAYSGALSEDNTTLTLSEVSGIIPANEPVVLFGDKGEYKFAQAAEAGTKVEGNALKAQLTEAVPTAEEGKAICVLNSVDGQLGFYKLNADKKLGANKAYLPVPVATTSTETAETSAPAVRIVFAGENGNVTGIESIAAEKNANAPIFNLAGQKMQGRVAPGLYIQGGKKILVK